MVEAQHTEHQQQIADYHQHGCNGGGNTEQDTMQGAQHRSAVKDAVQLDTDACHGDTSFSTVSGGAPGPSRWYSC